MKTFAYLEGLREGRKGNSYWLAIRFQMSKQGRPGFPDEKAGFLEGYKQFKAAKKYPTAVRAS